MCEAYSYLLEDFCGPEVSEWRGGASASAEPLLFNRGNDDPVYFIYFLALTCVTLSSMHLPCTILPQPHPAGCCFSPHHAHLSVSPMAQLFASTIKISSFSYCLSSFGLTPDKSLHETNAFPEYHCNTLLSLLKAQALAAVVSGTSLCFEINYEHTQQCHPSVTSKCSG